MRSKLASAFRQVDLVDLHVYGGILLAAVGVGLVFLPAALVAAGLGLAYLGLRR